MELSTNFIRRTIIEPGWSNGELTDYADEYGEPGYSFPYGASTPMILLADWNRIGTRHPRVFAQLESQGVEMVWCDEWVVDHEGASKAYRTQADSYSWQSSILWTDGDFLTPDDGIDAWIEEVVDNSRRCLPSNVWSASELTAAGFVQWMPDDPQRYESGWHAGQTDDPANVTREIRETAGYASAEIVFLLDESSQFYVGFSAWTRGDDETDTYNEGDN